MFVPDIVQHVGQYCLVATRHGKFFGELIRLSAAAFLVRPRSSAASHPPALDAAEITDIIDLPAPHL